MNYPDNAPINYPQEPVALNYNRSCFSCSCPGMALAFLVLLIAFALGLILGAVFFETILPVLSSVIVFAAALAAIVIALLIYCRCRRNS